MSTHRRAMPRLSWSVPCALAALLALGACDPAEMPETDAGPLGTSDAALDAGPRILSRTEVCTEAARIVCAGVADCCDVADAVPDCATRVEAWCDSTFGDALELPAAGFDPNTALAALEAGEALVATCDRAIIEWMYEPDGLAATFRGAGPSGETCHTGEEAVTFEESLSCAGGPETTCLTGAAGADGVCGPRVARAMPCRADTDCGPRLRCGFAGVDRQCLSREGLGDACEARLDCASLSCGVPEGSTLDECLEQTVQSVYCGAFL